MARVATRPSTLSFQCLYFDGSVLKSTGGMAIIHPQHAQGMLTVGHSVWNSPRRTPSSPQDHPEGLGLSRPQVLPVVRDSAVENRALPRLEDVAVTVIVKGDRPLDHVEELHLAGLDDHLFRLDPPALPADRGHDRADLPLKEPRPEHVPFLGGAVEGHHGIVALPAHMDPAVGSGLEERGDGDAEGRRQLAEGMERRRQPTGLDLRHHAGRQVRLLGELALLEATLQPQGLEALAHRHATSSSLRGLSGRPARRRRARVTKTFVIFLRYGCVRSVLSRGLDGRAATPATSAISAGVRRSPTRSAPASTASRGWEATAPRTIFAVFTRPPSRLRATATPRTGKSNEPRRRSFR